MVSIICGADGIVAVSVDFAEGKVKINLSAKYSKGEFNMGDLSATDNTIVVKLSGIINDN